MMPHQESAPSIYAYIWFPPVLRVTNGLNLLTASPRLSGEKREGSRSGKYQRRKREGLTESIRADSVKACRDFLAGNASPCLPREHRIGGHDIINALPYRGDNLRILWSVKDCLDELGYKNHHILLGASCGHGWRAETYS